MVTICGCQWTSGGSAHRTGHGHQCLHASPLGRIRGVRLGPAEPLSSHLQDRAKAQLPAVLCRLTPGFARHSGQRLQRFLGPPLHGSNTLQLLLSVSVTLTPTHQARAGRPATSPFTLGAACSASVGACAQGSGFTPRARTPQQRQQVMGGGLQRACDHRCTSWWQGWSWDREGRCGPPSRVSSGFLENTEASAPKSDHRPCAELQRLG